MEVQKPSEEQVQLVQMLKNGAKQAEIATNLGVSVRTVQSRLNEIRAKWGLNEREAISVFFYKNGWIE